MKVIEKPWGKEEILEHNKQYTVKRLTMEPNSRCSLQYHVEKHETVYVLEGELFVDVDGVNHSLESGEKIVICPEQIHRMYTGKYRAVYLECSTSYLDDVVRLEDDYGRK